LITIASAFVAEDILTDALADPPVEQGHLGIDGHGNRRTDF
jgi:hypothetical protein